MPVVHPECIGFFCRIRGNVGFFIITLDFVGYMGTVLVLVFKECFSPDADWLQFYNAMSGYVGVVCAVAFAASAVYLVWRHRKEHARGAGVGDSALPVSFPRGEGGYAWSAEVVKNR